MGLYVETLDNIPSEARRDYYIYLLDYGWDEPIGNALVKNYERMASLAASNRAVVIRGTNRVHFEDEVLSWHDINGQDATELLPAILITNRNPHKFKDTNGSGQAEPIEQDLRMILIPLRKFCRTATDVVALIERIFLDIKDQKALKDFKIARQYQKDNRFAMADMITLEPGSKGTEIPMENIVGYLDSGRSSALKVEKSVHPIHFEDRSGNEFERLVFAYLFREKNWDTLEWIGQSGGDDGRDIWGTISDETYCYQCANYRNLTLKKVTDDIDKLVEADLISDYFTVVCGGRVSAVTRTAIINYAKGAGISSATVWSSVEFEERLRRDTPELLRRFVDGEVFPELSERQNDEKIINKLAACFDRPAFTTPFRNEVSIPDFEKAITDTIEVLNTGMHRLRDGTVIKQISSRHEVSNNQLRAKVSSIYKLTVGLRDTFVELRRNDEIRPCGCEQKDCPVWILSTNACQKMDNIRRAIIDSLHSIGQGHELKIG